MSEDPTKRLPDEPNKSEELLPLIQSIRAELAELKRTVEIRLYDTRPIWEKVQADIAQLHEGQQRLEEKIEALRNETRTGAHDIKRQLSVLNDTLLQARADYKDLDKRVYQLEESRPDRFQKLRPSLSRA